MYRVWALIKSVSASGEDSSSVNVMFDLFIVAIIQLLVF